MIPSERALPVGVIILVDKVQALDPNPIRFAVCVVWRNVDPKTAVQQALVVFVEGRARVQVGVIFAWNLGVVIELDECAVEVLEIFVL